MVRDGRLRILGSRLGLGGLGVQLAEGPPPYPKAADRLISTTCREGPGVRPVNWGVPQV